MSERICVVGLGKLGACALAVFQESGFNPIGLDVNPFTVEKINNCLSPISNEPEVDEFYKNARRPLFQGATTSTSLAVEKSTCAVFIVPTPSLPNGLFDNQYLERAIADVAQEVRRQRKHDYLFIISSTVNPGSCDTLFLPLLQGYLQDLRFKIAYKPEFIALGSVMRDMRNPDLVLIGGGEETRLRCADIYGRVAKKGYAAIHSMSLLEAEITKISLNCAVTLKISFANQVDALAQRMGADSRKILKAVGFDSRIGVKCLAPGLPFAGPCFPRDNRMFTAIADQVGTTSAISRAVDEVNRDVYERVLQSILMIQSCSHQMLSVGILGLGYKPGAPTDDESLGRYLYERLRKVYHVETWDPVIMGTTSSMSNVIACDIVVITTPRPAFQIDALRSRENVIDPGYVLR